MLDVRNLVAVDIALHGYRFIIAEFVLAIVLAPMLGYLIWSLNTVVGTYTSLLCLNYIPMLIYAVDITRRKSAQLETKPILDRGEQHFRMTLMQILILVPLSMVALTIFQELRIRTNQRVVQDSLIP